MEQYIPLTALVAEINKRIIDAPINNIGHQRVWAYNDVKDIIRILDVKEVDLDNEIDKFYGMYRKNGITFSIEDNQECVDWKVDCNPNFEKAFAKHFFELGMQVSNKVQKGEEV